MKIARTLPIKKVRKESNMDTASQKLDDVIHQIAFENITGDAPASHSSALLAKLQSLGTQVWVDTGDLDKAKEVWQGEMTALTTNNTLANQVVQTGIMDQIIRDSIEKIQGTAPGLSTEEMVMEIGFIINCKIALRLVQAFKVKVSVELHPSISRDYEQTLNFGRRYYKICPEYFTVKIPLTPEGLLATRQLRKEGIPINFTLGFSARQNYLTARLSNPNYVNVFLGRLNQVVVENTCGNGEMVGEKATLSTQKALREVRDRFSDVTTHLIAASIRSGKQVAFLAGVDVLTIPPPALKDFVGSGVAVEEITCNIDREIHPGIEPDHSLRKRFDALWSLPESFVSLVDDLLSHEGLDDFNGAQLEQFCKEKGSDIFYSFSDADLKKIQGKGKIPCIADWPESVAVDDLMTQSALQSFAKDQSALDERIRSFL